MGEALFWGTLGASSLVLGCLIAIWFPPKEQPLGLVMGFGGGVLLSAVAYELVEEAFDSTHGSGWVAVGLFAGALTFYVGDLLVDRSGGADRKAIGGAAAEGSGRAIVLGTVLDGVPESIVLGLTLLGGSSVSVAMLAAVFISNLPEAIAATSGLRAGNWTTPKLLQLWIGVTVISGLSALVGYGLFDHATPSTVAFVNAFAAGAILTMLADTMMPEAVRHGGKTVGLATTLGFGVAFWLSVA